MKRFGLIGHPIKKSGSPALFTAAYSNRKQEDGSSYSYDLIEGEDFEISWKKFLDEYQAINVTAPFKEKAFAKAVELARQGKGRISGPAARIGATNLLVKTPEGIEAHNSDFTGIILAVAEAYYPGIVKEFTHEFGDNFYVKVHQFFRQNLGSKFSQKPQALVVGCGGAGKAAAIAAAELGFSTALMNRTADKAQAIADALPEYDFIVDPITDFKAAVKECELVIYTLPIALPEIEELSADDYAGETPGVDKVILEANYKTPSFAGDTLFRISSADAIYVPGSRWLIYQALTGYSLMTGIQPDFQAMAEVL